jgi:hypothetical protein
VKGVSGTNNVKTGGGNKRNAHENERNHVEGTAKKEGPDCWVVAREPKKKKKE